MLLRFVRPDALASYIRTNAPTVVSANPKVTTSDLVRAWLKANGGTGNTLAEQEHAFLTNASVPAGKLADRWRAYLATQGKSGNASQQFKSFFK